jgi:Cu(I)/Ag(I) efflux system protein CusF
MKKAMVSILLLGCSAFAAAQSGGMKGRDMKDMPKSTVHKATGVVTKVDKDKVTIKHGPVQSINWPAMTMTFTVKDKSLLDNLAKDRKVDFEFAQEGRDHVVTSVK